MKSFIITDHTHDCGTLLSNSVFQMTRADRLCMKSESLHLSLIEIYYVVKLKSLNVSKTTAIHQLSFQGMFVLHCKSLSRRQQIQLSLGCTSYWWTIISPFELPKHLPDTQPTLKYWPLWPTQKVHIIQYILQASSYSSVTVPRACWWVSQIQLWYIDFYSTGAGL